MLLVKPSASILRITALPLDLIEESGRTCYKSEDKITHESAKPFAEMILKRGHESVIEHAYATVRFICDRGVSHEIVRHRIASYSQESTRYCDYNNGQVAFVIPPWCKTVEAGLFEMFSKFPDNDVAENQWLSAMLDAENRYKQLRELGWKPEQARSVLPNSLKTEIVMSANLREFRHFFKLRTSNAAHPQMREVARPLLEEFKHQIPIIFDDITFVENNP